MQAETTQRKLTPGAYFKRSDFKYELLTLLVAALTARVCMLGSVSPFAIAFIAAVSMSGLNIHYAFIGAIAGLIALQGAPQLPELAVCALYYALYLLLINKRKDRGPFDKLILMIVAQTAMLPVFYRSDLRELVRGVIALGVEIVAALVMQNALRAVRSLEKRHVLTDGEQVGISAFFGVLLLSVTDVQAYGFSLPVALMLFFSMTATYARGLSGVAVAVSLSVVLTLSGEFPLLFVGSIAACALSGAALRSLGTPGVLGGFVTCSLVVGTYLYTVPHAVNLLNLFAAGLPFLLIPKERMLQLCAYLDASKDRERFASKSIKRMRTCIADEMRHTARVISDMARLYQPGELEPEPSDAFMQWIAQAAYGVCAGCPLKKPCWRDWPKAAEAILLLTQSHERGERIRIRRPFDPACKHMQQMAAAAWQAQNQYLVQRAMKRQTNEQYAFINRQMSGVCEILERLSQRVMIDRWLDEELEDMLLRGLDRRGYRVYGVDAAFPMGKLQMHFRMAVGHLEQLEAFEQTVEHILHRPVRTLSSTVDGRLCTLVMEEAQQLRASMGTATAAISESGVSGDSTGERRMERGRVLYALSDGMGAGAEAKGESDSALRLLFDLYDTGFSRDVALESVNKLLLARREDMYATLDAVYLDLRSGDAEFMKYGAPPSFVYRGDKLHTVQAEALPAGILNEAVPAIATAKLKRNDAVILFSDGALDALGDQTCASITAALTEAESSEAAARELLRRANERKHDDDMTVMVIRIA